MIDFEVPKPDEPTVPEDEVTIQDEVTTSGPTKIKRRNQAMYNNDEES